MGGNHLLQRGLTLRQHLLRQTKDGQQAPRRIVADPLSLQHLQPRSNLIARHRTTDSVYGLVLSWDALCTHHGADAGWKGTAASLRAAGGSTRSPTLTGSLISITRP